MVAVVVLAVFFAVAKVFVIVRVPGVVLGGVVLAVVERALVGFLRPARVEGTRSFFGGRADCPGEVVLRLDNLADVETLFAVPGLLVSEVVGTARRNGGGRVVALVVFLTPSDVSFGFSLTRFVIRGTCEMGAFFAGVAPAVATGFLAPLSVAELAVFGTVWFLPTGAPGAAFGMVFLSGVRAVPIALAHLVALVGLTGVLIFFLLVSFTA